MKTIYFKCLVAMSFLSFFACSDEQITDSIVNTQMPVLNSTDVWIRENYTRPYNIEVIYKWIDGQNTPGKNLVPPKIEFVKPLMSMLDSVWMQPYIAEAGADFFKTLTPKQFVLTGSPSYNVDGTRTQGTADAGRKIVLYSVNWYDASDKTKLWQEYIHVIFHEFAHIMHQTKNFDPDFKNTATGYTVAWTNFTNDEACEKGFITAYGMSAPEEDFVETMSIFLSTTPESWTARLDKIQSTTGKAAVEKKLEFVVNYLQVSWNIDAYRLRTRVNAAIDHL